MVVGFSFYCWNYEDIPKGSFWETKLCFCFAAGIEIPKYVDNVTPEYKPKFDALVSNSLETRLFTMFLSIQWA